MSNNAVYDVMIRWSMPVAMPLDEFKDYKQVFTAIKQYAPKYVGQIEDTGPSLPFCDVCPPSVVVCREPHTQLYYRLHNYHYQIYAKLKPKLRTGSLAVKLNEYLPGVVVQPASIVGKEALRLYSMKKTTRVLGPWADHRLFDLTDDFDESCIPSILYPWQQSLHDLCMGLPDQRTIHWISDIVGNSGKTSFVDYMEYHYGFPHYQYSDSKDTFNLVSKEMQRKAYFFDLSRTKPKLFSTDDIYACLEAVKNGSIVNSKYETSRSRMRRPHVIVFANQEPDYDRMSLDRWKVYTINDKKELILNGVGNVDTADREVPPINYSSKCTKVACPVPPLPQGDLNAPELVYDRQRRDLKRRRDFDAELGSIDPSALDELYSTIDLYEGPPLHNPTSYDEKKILVHPPRLNIRDHFPRLPFRLPHNLVMPAPGVLALPAWVNDAKSGASSPVPDPTNFDVDPGLNQENYNNNVRDADLVLELADDTAITQSQEVSLSLSRCRPARYLIILIGLSCFSSSFRPSL